MTHDATFTSRSVSMRSMRCCASVLISLGVWCVASSIRAEAVVAAGGGDAKGGHLVIVGGALDVEHAAIYHALLDRIGPTGTLGILPTASGVPEESGPGTVEDFKRYAKPTQTITLLDIRDGEVAKASDSAWADRITDCEGLWFTGGVQSRIVDTFRPAGQPDSPAYEAMLAVLRKGGVIGGTSAGAAMMSDPMILWGNSHEALLVGVVNDAGDFGVGVGKGMGFFPYGIVDQHFFRRARLGRLLAACEHTGVPMGFGIEENCALVVDLANDTAQVIGSKGVLFCVVRADDDASSLAFDVQHWDAGTTRPMSAEASVMQADPMAIDRALLLELLSGAPRRYQDELPMDLIAQGASVTSARLVENSATAEARRITHESLAAERAELAKEQSPATPTPAP